MKKDTFDIKKIILKSIANSLSKGENTFLQEWLSDSNNKRIYNQITDELKIEEKIALYQKINTREAYKKIESQIYRESKTNLNHFFKYAAVIVAIFSLSFLFIKYFPKNEKLEIVNTNIIFQNADDSITEINSDSSKKIKDSKGNVIAIQKGNSVTIVPNRTNRPISYGTIIVPKGKKFEITLADQTKVFLNAETSLKFHLDFKNDQERKVFVKGEAFFDVTKSKTPFIVSSDAINVKVLGTQFNFSSYPNEANEVVLVEGSVELSASSNIRPVLLKPGQKGLLTQEQFNIESVQTRLYTSWIKDELIFRNKKFSEIATSLERAFNVNIRIENSKLKNVVFNASFKNQSIINIINYFKEIHNINYEIKDNIVVIN